MQKALIYAVLVFLMAACTAASAAERKVVATVLPVWVFAKNVAGDRVDVELLMKPGTDPHGFALKPSDAKKLAEASLILLNGAGLERNIMRGMDSAKTFDTSEGVELIPARFLYGEEEFLGTIPNPHFWLDPVSAQRQVENIAVALSELDPEGKEFYFNNALIYSERLQSLHEEIRNGLLELDDGYLITYHESFNYFARRYGFTPFSLTGPDAETPLPGRMKAVYDIVRDENVRAVFEEAQFRSGTLGNLGRDLGVRVCTLNTLISGSQSPDLYERAMRENLETIIYCLGRK